jgi:hypothetical protein
MLAPFQDSQSDRVRLKNLRSMKLDKGLMCEKGKLPLLVALPKAVDK